MSQISEPIDSEQLPFSAEALEDDELVAVPVATRTRYRIAACRR